MQKLKIEEIIRLINKRETFEARAFDDSFRIKVNKYVPYCCTAIHDGNNLRSDLNDKIALDDYERWYEEDPSTGDFIGSLPITLIGHDSRFEYDLNRRPEECIYEEAWGKEVWKKRLNSKEKQVSLRKHANFYKVVHALIQKLNELYGSCVVYDMHSYNHVRWDRNVPLFNIGTERIDHQRFGGFIEHWQKELSGIKINGVANETKVNDVFLGRGYNLEYITTNFPETLVLATEVKKVYCNELTGEYYPKIIRELQQGIKEAILNNAQYFSALKTNWKSDIASHLLDKKEDKTVATVDRGLFRLLRNFELLAYVNPINTNSEFKKFVKSKFTEPPKFRYSPIKVNPFELKQKLGSLPTGNISDVSLRNLYESVIGSYFDKVDLLASLNTKKFLYNSLRYFGRPSSKDLRYANYLLHLPDIPSEPKNAPHLSVDKVMEAFKSSLSGYEIQCKLETSNKLLAGAMVLNSKRTVLISNNAQYSQRELNALIEHEIGVHMVTTQNSAQQKLKVFNLGLPVNTLTQEGLAIFAEYISGNISLKRLRTLALRVVLTDMMCSGADFSDCFEFLRYKHKMDSKQAFTMVTRIFRGGGFTKDFLYLSGFVRILNLWNSGQSLNPLLVGKTSLEFYDTIQEMIDREMITPPKYITQSFKEPDPEANDPVYDYIVSGLR